MVKSLQEIVFFGLDRFVSVDEDGTIKNYLSINLGYMCTTARSGPYWYFDSIPGRSEFKLDMLDDSYCGTEKNCEKPVIFSSTDSKMLPEGAKQFFLLSNEEVIRKYGLRTEASLLVSLVALNEIIQYTQENSMEGAFETGTAGLT